MFDFAKLLVKKPELENPFFDHGSDLGLGNGCDVMKTDFCQIPDLSALDHAPIPNKCHALTAKLLVGLGDLGGERAEDYGARTALPCPHPGAF